MKGMSLNEISRNADAKNSLNVNNIIMTTTPYRLFADDCHSYKNNLMLTIKVTAIIVTVNTLSLTP